MWIAEAIEWLKNLWENGLKDFVLTAAVISVFLLSGILRRLYKAVKEGILGLLTTEGAISFLISAAAVLFFLTKIGVIKW